MPAAICSMCKGPVSVMKRDLSTGLCPACQAAAVRAEQAATLDALREFEDGMLRLVLRPVPKAWRPGFEGVLSRPRFRGLSKLVSGLIAAAPLLLITVGFGRLTGYYAVSTLVGLPLAISMVGLIEILIGISFVDLAERFDRGNALVKLGLVIVVLPFALAYAAGFIYCYQHYVEGMP